MPKFIDLQGKKINRLTALQYIKGYDKKTGQGQWECLCDCGNIHHVTTQNLFYGRVKSCGCYKREGGLYSNRKRKPYKKRIKPTIRITKKKEEEAIEKLVNIFGGV